MYCGSDSTWATVEDLYDRFGDEAIDQISVRTVWDNVVQRYVTDESDEMKQKVINMALCDAREFIKLKMRCLYTGVELLDTQVFSAVKLWHIRLTIELLKLGGDCSGCACVNDLQEYIKCGSICSEEGNCLSLKSSFLEVSEAVFCCELKGRGCGCC